jgi:hypothetical protein
MELHGKSLHYTGYHGTIEDFLHCQGLTCCMEPRDIISNYLAAWEII